ncbi:MarR family winged helix-turn-helix transcriptional regulator [Streptomyces himalayensis]|uniref:Winged helix-turn-helix transcriptional regulator n=1 Tax=Streptomyces himalayensis subsp. himalayensis TaxID=2756131 RepID=A0A7W0I820_9ACTN|nr:MarR family winged helix-turn-helix transcriptional regulator [Streptomyces himalayensis]MBA2945812.1 winged helix-turn-helix transcriptional regulator [Streptomyces himalayensis subsp. himalayensis]
MKETPRWLTPAERDGWRGLTRMWERLSGRVARHLQSESSLSTAEYTVLVHLTDAPDGRRRTADLVGSLEWEKSRMSHQVSRMMKRGLVVREECPQDGRGAVVVITPAGRDAIAAAAPRHVEAVRRLFVDPLTPEQLRAFARIANRVLEQLDERPM